MQEALTIIHVIIGLALIGLVLLQRGKGAEAGAAFGSGSSGNVFGARGATTFLSKATRYLIIVFFITSLLLARSYAQTEKIGKSKVQQTTEQPKMELPTGESGETDKVLDLPKKTDTAADEAKVEPKADNATTATGAVATDPKTEDAATSETQDSQ